MKLTDGVITMRTPTLDDAEAMAAAVQASSDHLHDFMVWATPDYDVDMAREWISGATDANAHPFLILDPAGDVVGSAGLNRVDRVNDRCDIGYWLRPEATGNGYATRASNLLLDYAIGEVGLHRVEIYMAVENEASRRVAERTAAEYEGVLRGRLKYNGRYHDAHMFALVADT